MSSEQESTTSTRNAKESEREQFSEFDFLCEIDVSFFLFVIDSDVCY